VHYLSVDEAKAIVLELNKTLNTLDVEIAGLQAKISTIEEYKSDKTVSLDIVEKLEEMLREQTIELAGALARKDMATEIRYQAEGYFSLTSMKDSLQKQLDTLKSDLSDHKAELRRNEHQLAHPTTDMLPPQVFQNKVTIYPVHVEGER
jgi:chromosome segregation ATPase